MKNGTGKTIDMTQTVKGLLFVSLAAGVLATAVGIAFADSELIKTGSTLCAIDCIMFSLTFVTGKKGSEGTADQ